MDKFLSLLFNTGETYCSGSQYDTLADSTPRGPLVTINPVHTKRADANVIKHRNFLVEMDKGTLDQQAAAMEGVPFSACTFSGSKSLHYIVALEEDIPEILWRTWSKALVRAIPGADVSVTNPSRYTRLPGVVRPETGKVQELLALKSRIPVQVFQEWILPHLPKQQMQRKVSGGGNIFEAHPLTHAFLTRRHPVHRTQVGRNNALFKCAADLNDVGIPYERALTLLTDPALDTGLDHQEITRTIESAYRRG